jgi:hypothetical protein
LARTAIHKINTATVKAIEAGPNDGDGQSENQQFIPGLQVQETAWNTLLCSGAGNCIDYSLLLELSETYSIQSIYRQTGMQLIESSMNMSAMATVNTGEIDNQQFQRQFSAYFSMILQMEESLLEKYKARESEGN